MRDLVIDILLKHAAENRIEWDWRHSLWDSELGDFRPTPENFPVSNGYLDASKVTREYLEQRSNTELLGFLDDDACLFYR